MPTKQITNPVATGYGPLAQTGWTTPVPPLNDQILLECVNTSAGTLNHGDLVVVDRTTTANSTTGWIPQPAVAAPPISPQAAGVAVTTTTSASDVNVIGPVSMTGDASTFSGSIAIGAPLWVCVGGVARVQIGTNVAAVGTALGSFTTAKQAQAVALAAAQMGSFFGINIDTATAQTAKDANGTIRALIKSF